MDTVEMPTLEQKIAKIEAYGNGYQSMNHSEEFQANNIAIFTNNNRSGIYRTEYKDLTPAISKLRCNVLRCAKTFDTWSEYEHHFNAFHRFVCGQCSRNLPNVHLLDLHLSERHDNYFAVQAAKRPMYRCFLEECDVLSRNGAERRDHCITAHNFPPDFRFDRDNRIRNPNPKKSGRKHLKPKAQPSITVVDPSKMETSQDEDIELENKSILLTAQRKKTIPTFTFGQKRVKGFAKTVDLSYAKMLTANSEVIIKSGSTLEDVHMVDDLKNSLPQ